ALVGLAHLALDSGTLRPGARIRPHLSVTVPFDTLQRLVAAAAPKQHRPGCRSAGRYPGAAFGLPMDLARITSSGAPETEQSGPDGTGVSLEGCTCGQELSGTVIGAEVDSVAMVGVEPATLEDGSPISPALLARLACGSQMHRVIFGPDSEVLDSGREERLFTAGQTRAIIARDKRCQYPHCNAPPGEGEIHHSIAWWAQFGSTNIALGILLCWFHHDYVHAHAITIERRDGHWVFTRKDGSLIGGTELAA
ncbi:HNH endonuclease signature motif containing protein, partial [Georgenia sp. SYP-B2076]|uniref:HNH endonuclease signature motif containing protein n=1 Tax=Georgenia sp. SYP-B2076 TaxID=2495881 RepID=UPI00197AB6E1